MNKERVESLLKYAELVSISNVPDADKRELAAFKIIEQELGIKLNEVKKKNEALAIFLMDTSGSMGPWEKNTAKDYYNYALEEIKKKYPIVNELIITHGTEAVIHNSLNDMYSTGGGTIVSKGLRAIYEKVQENLDKNIYVFQFSDGDNLTSDCDKCIKIIKDMLDDVEYFDYIELNQYNRHSTLASFINKSTKLKKDNFRMQTFKHADDALKGVKFKEVLKGEK